MNKKSITVLVITLLLSGCTWFGLFQDTKITTTDPVTGKKTVTYEPAPLKGLFPLLDYFIPGAGAIALAGIALASKAKQASNSIMDANKDAIENADWTQINTAESYKALLKLKQDAHADAALIRKTYDAWNKKDILTVLKKKQAIKKLN